MHAQVQLLPREPAEHPGICLLLGFLFNVNFLIVRNPADRSGRAPGKNRDPVIRMWIQLRDSS